MIISDKKNLKLTPSWPISRLTPVLQTINWQTVKKKKKSNTKCWTTKTSGCHFWGLSHTPRLLVISQQLEIKRVIGEWKQRGDRRLWFGMANSSGRHKSVAEGNSWFKGNALCETAEEFLIANIKLQTQKLWRVLYSVYLDRLTALVVMSVSVIKTSICCSKCVMEKPKQPFATAFAILMILQLILFSFYSFAVKLW